jgi:hypothetical protein
MDKTKRPGFKNTCADSCAGAASGRNKSGKLESAAMYGYYGPAQQQRKPIDLLNSQSKGYI